MESGSSMETGRKSISPKAITCPSLILGVESGSGSGSQVARHKEDTITRPSTSFFCTKLNVTTFLIIEDDSFGEQPHIYVKIYPNVIFISDTGCNSPRQENKIVSSLRQYLETFPAPANSDTPLNPNGSKPYLILCTHCHYDHILGIPPFLSAPEDNPTILASSHSKPFLQDNLPAHSLCKYLHIPTPSYHISHWGRDLEYLSYCPPSDPHLPAPDATPLRIQLLHIPGHTPDSLAWYDVDAHHLYIGDMFYARRRPADFPIATSTTTTTTTTGSRLSPAEGLPPPALDDDDDAAIIFPAEGDWVDYMSSLEALLSFIRFRNSELGRRGRGASSEDAHGPRPPPEGSAPPRVLLGCGHVTASGDAETMAGEVRALFWGILQGSVPVRRSEVRRGEVFDYWCEGDEARFSVLAPRRLVEAARRHFRLDDDVMQT